MINIYYETAPKDNIAITFSGNSRHQIPDMSFDMVLPSTLPKIPEVISPVVITYSPPPPIENMQEPPVIDKDTMDKISAKELELYSIPMAASDQHDELDGYEGIMSAIDSASHGLSRQVEVINDLLETTPVHLKRLIALLLRPNRLESYSDPMMIGVSRLILDIERQAERFMLRYLKEAGNNMSIVQYVCRRMIEKEKRKIAAAYENVSSEEKELRKETQRLLLERIKKEGAKNVRLRREKRLEEEEKLEQELIAMKNIKKREKEQREREAKKNTEHGKGE